MRGRFGRLFEFLDLGLEVLQMLLFAFTECPLRSTILRFPLLHSMSV
jgi:hypothetical protein